ncbi:MAG: M20/M25/M40 family metallo-hydrolase [Bdellovibrionota bacterium]
MRCLVLIHAFFIASLIYAQTNSKLPPKSIYDAKANASSPSSESIIPEIKPEASVDELSSENDNSSPEEVSDATASTSSVSSEEVIDGIIEESPERVAKLQEQLKGQVELLEELVSVSSDTKLEIEGVNKVQSIIERELKKLKFKVELIDNPDPFTKSGKLLVGTFAGKNTEQYITLLSHADTVFPATTGFKKFEKISDSEAKGPGVIDDKGGVVVGLEALRLFLLANPNPEYSVRFIVSPSEEIGSTGFLNLFAQYSLSSVAVFGLEPALDKGDIVDSRRGDRWYEVTVKGREAHAGRQHRVGVNACHELAIKIEKLQKLTNYRRDVTISVGAIQGGKDKYAIVCGEASMKLDVRFSGPKNRKRILKLVEGILNTQYVKAASDGARATTEWKIVDDPMPFNADPASKNLIEIYKKVILDVEGRKISAARSGGTSDINFFYRPGVVLIDGLGAIGSGMHTHEEKIQLRSLQTRAIALSKLIQAAGL